jgi:Flp pilus assembly protein TadG
MSMIQIPPSVLRASFKLSERHAMTKQSGVVAIMMALLLPVLLGFLALAIDVGNMMLVKNRMQVAADSAALVAATSLQHGQGLVAAHDWALTASAANNFTHGLHATTVTVDVPPGTGSHAQNTSYVKVTVQHTTPTFVAGLIGVAHTLTTVSAVSGPAGGGNPCLLALGSSGAASLKANGNVQITANDCGIFVDSSDASAIDCFGKSNTFTASVIGVVGGIDTKQCNTSTSAVHAGAVQTPDPFLGFPAAPVTTCLGNIPNTKNIHLVPGTYCKGISITGTHTVTMDPGVYVIHGGGFSIGGSTSVSGSGVTIYNTGTGATGTYAYGPVNFTGGAGINLSAPSTGVYAGMLFYQDPLNTLNATLGGNSDVVLSGNLYFPTSSLTLSGSNTTNIPIGSVVAKNIIFNAGTKFNITNVYGASGVTGSRSALYE